MLKIRDTSGESERIVPFADPWAVGWGDFDNYLSGRLSEDIAGYWNSLTDSEKTALLIDTDNEYYDEGNAFRNSWLDVDKLIADLESLTGTPTSPNYANVRQNAINAINAENQQLYSTYDEQEALLNQLRDSRTADYESGISDLRNDYANARNSLLSNQYRQNSQTMDTLQSGMDRARRNALEAGASAGVRIAGNINTLLSAQNKQAATSMETANQLSQMMINQRNAEQGLKSNYNDYMSQDAANRAAIDDNRNQVMLSTQGRVDSKFNSEYSAQQQAHTDAWADWKRSNSGNAFADSYYNYKNNKSNYS